jgi:pimeloyl-ACP methyl ester carboxylesterase
MRAFLALGIMGWGLLTACTIAVPGPLPAQTPHAEAAAYRLPGYIRGSKEAHSDRVIVFIHGVFGDGISTWTNATTGAYFPALIRDDPTFDGVDIWVHQFETPKLRRSYTIDELADHLRTYLNNDNVITNHRQVIFVCHSLGGLVARAYLLKYRDLTPDRVPMLYFFSTPTTGSDLANIARLISANPQLTEMRKMTTVDAGVLGVWEAQWSSSSYNQTTRSYCAYELLPTMGIVVVQRESARHLCNTRPDPVARNHIDIVKPTDNTGDESYLAFREAYRDTFRQTDNTAKKPGLWNLTSKDTALLRVQNVTQNPGCLSVCWTDRVIVAPGDDITINLSYRNAGLTTAFGTRAYLSIPRAPLIATPIMARLESSNAQTAVGMITLETTGGPVLLIPVEIWAYEKNDATKRHDVPYQQRATMLTSEDGLRLGDIMPEDYRHHIVARYHCEPVTFAGVAVTEALSFIIKHAIDHDAGESPNPSALGHIEAAEIGEHARWVSELRDLHDGSDFLFLLYYFNDTDAILRGLQATLRLDPADPTLLQLRLTSAKGQLRTATAHLAYRPGTTERPLLVSAVHSSKAPLMLLDRLASGAGEQEIDDLISAYPRHGDTIDLGDLPPQGQIAAALAFTMSPQAALAEDEKSPLDQKTVLNGDDTDALLTANTPVQSSVWAPYLSTFNRDWPLSFAVTAHNTGHTVAKDIRLHLSLEIRPDMLEARGRVTAKNAPAIEGVALVALGPRSSTATVYYESAVVFRSGKTGGRRLDASEITGEGLFIGDLDPAEWETVVVAFIAASISSEGSSDGGVITPESLIGTSIGLENTTNATMRDVILRVELDGTPNERVLTLTLASAGKPLRSKVVRWYADVPGVTLQPESATVYTTTGAKEVDIAKATEKGVRLGDLRPGAQMTIHVGFEVLTVDN